MNITTQLSKKIALLSGTALISTAAMLPVTSAYGQNELRLEEIIVTAEKRETSLQDTSITLSVFSEATLDRENIIAFDDYVLQLPSVQAAKVAPGQNNITIRGIGSSTIGTGVNLVGGVPTVALYIDEQPITAISRNIDLHIYDVSRIEVLSGPQGTLYGASSLAGTIKVISNKPDPNEFTAGFEASVSSTKGGDLSNVVQGFVNIPLSDNAAVRAVFYNSVQGGYIDNVLGTSEHIVTGAATNDPSQQLGTLTQGPNTQLVEENFNDATTTGFRLSGLIDINDDWQVRGTVIAQRLDVEGVFDYQPERGDLNVVRFAPDETNDRFAQFNATVEGKIGTLDVLYAGSYLDRKVDAIADYTGYGAVGYYIDYYTCDFSGGFAFGPVNYAGADLIVPGDANASCAQQDYVQRVKRKDTRQTHELRFSTDQEKRIRAIGGLFYQDAKLNATQSWSLNEVFAISGDLQPGRTFISDADADVAQAFFDSELIADPGVTFQINDLQRREKQFALFGEITFDIVPDTLSMTGGARWYDIDTSIVADIFTQFGPSSSDIPEEGFKRKDKDVIFKANLTWTPNDDQLYYATFSQGFRPGFFNRNGGPSARLPGVILPSEVDQDVINNYEIGWKLTAFDSRLRVNGAAFWMVWDDLQSTIINSAISQLAFQLNTADARIRGVEMDFAFAATEELTFTGAFTVLNAELTSDFDNTGVEGGDPFPDDAVEAREGDKLPFAPTFSGVLGFQYNYDYSDEYRGFLRGTVSYVGESYNSLVNTYGSRELQKSYAIGNFGIGLESDNIRAEIFVNNLWNKRAEVFINTSDATRRITTNRPRTVGFRVSYKM